MSVSLGDLCSLIVDSEHKTAPKAAVGYPLVRTTDIGNGRIVLDRVQRVDEATYRAWTRRAVPRPGDLILAREAPVGGVGVVLPGMNPCLGQRTVLLRPDPTRVEPLYLNYVLASAPYQERMASLSNGATVPHLNMSDIRQLEINLLPPLEDQRRVAGLLSAHDELIENNTRRIEILEEMAQAIYREWFVNFRYPGHEEVPLVDSDLGLHPRGWDVCRLGDLLVVDKGLSYKGTFLGGGGAPMVNLKCFSPGGGFRRSGTKLYSGESKPKHQIQPGDIVVANTDLTQEGGVIGNPAIVPRRGFENGGLISHHLFVLRNDRRTMPRAYLFELLASADFKSHARSTASGTTVLGFRTKDCEGYRFALPPVDLRAAFSKAVEPMIDHAEALLDQIEVLRTTRDLLLPRLISGEVDVSNLDLDVGELVS